MRKKVDKTVNVCYDKIVKIFCERGMFNEADNAFLPVFAARLANMVLQRIRLNLIHF